MTEPDLSPPTEEERPSTSFNLTTLIASVVVVAVAVGALAFFLGAVFGPREEPDSASVSSASVDAGFSRDMQRHHAQAVEMSNLILDESKDRQVRTLARDILLTQQQQIGQMYGWLRLWGLDQSSSEPAMAWMSSGGSMSGHKSGSDAAAPMPGMATEQQIARLDGLEGADADRYFLQLMIPHHEGALGMAEAAASDARTPQVRQLAEAIVAAQTSELVVLRAMLEERGGSLPDTSS